MDGFIRTSSEYLAIRTLTFQFMFEFATMGMYMRQTVIGKGFAMLFKVIAQIV